MSSAITASHPAIKRHGGKLLSLKSFLTNLQAAKQSNRKYSQTRLQNEINETQRKVDSLQEIMNRLVPGVSVDILQQADQDANQISGVPTNTVLNEIVDTTTSGREFRASLEARHNPIGIHASSTGGVEN